MLIFGLCMYGCVKPTVVETSARPEASDTQVEAMMSASIPPEMRRDWPFAEWQTAKAYTFNFNQVHNTTDRYVWSDDGWSESIHQSIDLSREDAQKALMLIHQTGGGLVLSKCPIVPRHSVVFFDLEGEPVGSMNICFSCEDTLSYPRYYATEEEARNRYQLSNAQGDGSLLFEEIHPQNMQAWSEFFSRVGAERFEQHSP